MYPECILKKDTNRLGKIHARYTFGDTFGIHNNGVQPLICSQLFRSGRSARVASERGAVAGGRLSAAPSVSNHEVIMT